MTKVVKVEQGMQEPVYYNFHPLMYDSDYDCSISGLVGDLETWNDDDDLLQQVDPYDWKQDPYHGDDEAEENAKLFAELDDLLERLPFLNDELKENVVGVDALVVVVEEQLERIEHVVDEEIEKPRKRKRENEDESASANVLLFGKIIQEEKVESSLEGREGNERLWDLRVDRSLSREAVANDGNAKGGIFGDCGVWVCINLYQLAYGVSLDVDDPVDFALAYHEKMVPFCFSFKI
nr:F-box domain-containing protein [Tanacetum cinerariifolium]